MEKQQERLLIPQDFQELSYMTAISSVESTSIINPNMSSAHKLGKPLLRYDSKQYSDLVDLNTSDVKTNDQKHNINPLFNCLNPQNFSFYHCFNKESNSYALPEEKMNSAEFFISTSNRRNNSETKVCDSVPDNFLCGSSLPHLTDSHKSETRNSSNPSIPSVNQGLGNLSISGSKKPNLLTPDNFLASAKSVKKSQFPNIPDIFDEALPVRNFDNFPNQSHTDFKQSEKSILPNFNETISTNISNKDKELLETECFTQEQECNRQKKKCLMSEILTPDNFTCSSVRRKLDFINSFANLNKGIYANHLQQVDKKNETEERRSPDFPIEKEAKEIICTKCPKANETTKKNYPEFQCSLNITDNVYNYEDTSVDNKESKILSNHSYLKGNFPPIGVFWDIENCRVPKGLSATHVVQAIRNQFFEGYKEVEFICVCDTLKENPKILEELNNAQVNIMHVGSIVKNAADDKLLQSMRRFADIHGAGASIILISGDSDFATELYDLRYRKKLHVILVHNEHTQDSLKLSAHETALFSEVTQELPPRSSKPKHNSSLSREIMVWNLPAHIDSAMVRRRLHFLSSNCGGKGIVVSRHNARILFDTCDLAARAKKRIDGEDVYGNRVTCTFGRSEKDPSRYKLYPYQANGRFQPVYPSNQQPLREFERREEDLPEFPASARAREELPMDGARQDQLTPTHARAPTGHGHDYDDDDYDYDYDYDDEYDYDYY